LKKSTNKLLSIAVGNHFAPLTSMPDARSKSFLLLFFKKEVLPSFTFPAEKLAAIISPQDPAWTTHVP
jgi:hypothetical protein